MSDPVPLALSCLGGILLGMFFFGGLWWTIRKGVSSEKTAFWFLGSLLIRTGTIVLGFYWIAGGQSSRLVASLLGFLVARFILVRWFTRRGAIGPTPREEEEALLAP
ncbi:ATP synthase subunit I [Tundrisphaera lichenicola]|uniref:N-ATPase subunit AtpR n=1 Tax=Tundrisphaera lichenicola TaxID=2029860 RepID=UPI003EBE9333